MVGPSAGILADQFTRTRLLAWAIALWGVAMALSAPAPNFLLLPPMTRVALGAVTVAAAPPSPR